MFEDQETGQTAIFVSIKVLGIAQSGLNSGLYGDTLASGVAKGGLGGNFPHFCQNGTRDCFTIDEKKLGREGSNKPSEKQKAWPKTFQLRPLLL